MTAYTYLVEIRKEGNDWTLIEDCIPRGEAIEIAKNLAADNDTYVEVWCKETDTLAWAATPFSSTR